MRIGWRKSFKRYVYRNVVPHTIGIEFREDGLHCVVLDNNTEFSNHSEVLDSYHFSLENWQNQLNEWVKRKRLMFSKVCVALSPEHYQLFQADKPAVHESAVADALRWSVSELISTDVNMMIDYFDIPSSFAGQNKVNVVAAAEDLIRDIATGLHRCDLEVLEINVAELTSVDLLPTPSGESVMSLIQLSNGDICLNISKQEHVYVSRILKGYQDLQQLKGDQLKQRIEFDLSLEIQRSMDYYQGQLRQDTVKHIIVAIDTLELPLFCEALSNVMMIDTQPLSLDCKMPPDLKLDASNRIALASALSCHRLNAGKDYEI